MTKIFAEHYGCSANLSDKEIMLGLLKKSGFKFTDKTKDSNLILIITCMVKKPTENRMIHRIRELTKLNKPMIVAGCMSMVSRHLIEKLNPKASIIGPDSIEKIVFVVREALKKNKIVLLKGLDKPKINLPKCRKNPVIGITQIGRGCLLKCQFCVEPYRGKLFSYPKDQIVKDVKSALKEGCKEIWLTSLDNGCYGFDKKSNLAELLNSVSGIEGDFFVRVGMSNPIHVKKILDKLIEAYKHEKILKFLHLPIQSFSDKILKDMKRGYKVKDVLKIIKRFKEEIPEMTISTDIITGYPTETEADHKKNVKYLKQIEFDIVNLSKFGRRPGAHASKLKEISRKMMDRRSVQLSKIIKQTEKNRNDKWIGWKTRVLIDEKGKNKTFMGRNFSYKPVVVKSEKNILGQFVVVKITEAKSNYLVGELA
jgi:threonylcarbamoyladenosine tRNA methylthiotransferase CDKAL1